MKFMIIKNGCVTLRPIEERDFELLLYLINAPEIERMTGGWNLPVSPEAEREWIRNYKNSLNNIKLMIELDNGYTIGMISLTDIDWKNRVALIEYKISAPIEYRKAGDMNDAIEGILNYAFEELNMNCITSIILEDNIFSLKLVKKFNFKEEGVLRQRVYKNGKFRNQVILSLLKNEYEQE